MMNKNITADKLYEELKKIIKLPESALSVTIQIDANKEPIITVKSYVKPTEIIDNELRTMTQTFEVNLIDKKE